METIEGVNIELYSKNEGIRKEIHERAQAICKELDPDLILQFTTNVMKNAEGKGIEQPGIMLRLPDTQDELGSMFYIQLSTDYLHNHLKSDIEKHYRELVQAVGGKYN